MPKAERRQTARPVSKIEVRAEGDAKKITGYAAVFYNPADARTSYWMWDDFEERLLPGCFDRAISESHDARALFDHDSQNLLGRVASGTCMLSVDSVGLRFEVPVDMNDPDHQRVVAKIERGDLTGCSFAFANASSTWQETYVDGKRIDIRNITDLDLFDVGPVTYPAYEATEVGIRTAATDANQLTEARSLRQAVRDQQINHRLAEAVDVEATWAAIN